MLSSDVTSVNVFYRINQLPVDPNQERARAIQEREFMIGSIGVWFFRSCRIFPIDANKGFSDSLGILCASALSIPMEVSLCHSQVSRGKMLCKGV
jgi:battenin